MPVNEVEPNANLQAMTNQVREASFFSKLAILKATRPQLLESRFKGKLVNLPLQNEWRLSKWACKAGINTPMMLIYKSVGDREILLQEKVQGKTCYQLRPDLTSEELDQLEKVKGTLLFQIGQVAIPTTLFGAVSDGSKRYSSWAECFMDKVVATVASLQSKYDDLTKLSIFGEFVNSEANWQSLLAEVIKIYSSSQVQLLLASDDKPTLGHGDFWDGNLMIVERGDDKELCVIDWERGGVGGASFDLALWLEWKIGGNRASPDPLTASKKFLEGYISVGGVLPTNICQFIAVYGVWQYLDFLVNDLVYGVDRSDESMFEITKLMNRLRSL